MKKTFTLLAILAFVSAASFAQYNHSRDYDDDRDMAVNNRYDKNNRGNDKGSYYFTAKEKNMQIALINRDYDSKIASVKSRLFVGRSKKIQLINSFEYSRKTEIRNVIERFNDRRNRFDRRDNRRYDNGKRDKW